MKRIVAFICALCLLCSAGYAKDLQLEYFNGVANPKLELPGPKKAELKNGVGLVEAEDCALSKNTTLTEDITASEGMAVTFSPAKSAKVLADSEEGPTLKAEFNVIDAGLYNVWALVKPTRGGCSLFCAFDNEAYVQKNFTEGTEWVWYKIGSASLSEGTAHLSLKYRQRHLVIDKFIFTTDLTFTPVETDDMPQPQLSGESSVTDLFPEPEIKPISGHPRVFLTPEYIEKLKVYIKSDEIAPAWAAVQKIAEQNLNSELPKDVVGNYDSNILNWVQCRALLYALGQKDANWAKETIKHASNILRTVIEWCGYIYSDEGVVLQLFGIEGDTFTIENIDGEDRYIYTDKILNYEENGFTSLNYAMYHYMLPCNHPGYNQHSDYLYNYYQLPQQKEAIITWNVAAENAIRHRLPSLSYTEEESAEITDIKEIAEPTLEVALCDIILGKKSIDTFDTAIAQAKADGYDRWIEICQDAYDRYLEKLDK